MNSQEEHQIPRGHIDPIAIADPQRRHPSRDEDEPGGTVRPLDRVSCIELDAT